MKNIFVIPEVRSFELSCEDIMAASAETITTNVTLTRGQAALGDSLNEQYNRWKGLNWNQNQGL